VISKLKKGKLYDTALSALLYSIVMPHFSTLLKKIKTIKHVKGMRMMKLLILLQVWHMFCNIFTCKLFIMLQITKEKEK